MDLKISEIKDIKYADEIVNIWAKGFNKNVTVNDIEIIKNRMLSGNYKIYATFINKKMVAVVIYIVNKNISILKWISTLFLYRNKKIASNMLEYSLNEISKLTDNVLLYCNTSKLEEFYKKFGFVKISEMQFMTQIYNKKSNNMDTLPIIQRKMKLRIR